MQMTVSLSQALRFGWNCSLRTFGLNIQIGLVYVAFAVLTAFFFLPYEVWTLSGWPQVVSFSFITGSTGVGFLLAFFLTGLRYGLFAVYLDLVDRGESDVRQLFSQLEFFKMVKIFIVSLLLPIAVAIGFILLVIPGFIALARFSLVPFFIVDQDCSIGEAFSRSYEVTRGNVWRLLSLFLLQAIFGPISSLMVLFPFLFIAEAHIYRQLVPKQEIFIFYEEMSDI